MNKLCNLTINLYNITMSYFNCFNFLHNFENVDAIWNARFAKETDPTPNSFSFQKNWSNFTFWSIRQQSFSQNFRIKNLNGKLKRYFQLDDDWDKEAYLENLILQKSVKSVEIIGTKKIEDLECADINDENQEGDESDEDDNYEICIDNILEIEKLMVGNQEETDEDFDSNFTRL